MPPATHNDDFSIQRITTPADFQEAMRIRFAVFVDEQGVPAELEPDEYDSSALHLLAWRPLGDEAVATLRIIDKGNGVAKIGRVAVLSLYRGMGLGRLLMETALRTVREAGYQTAILDAQSYIIPFYEKLGFVAEGPEFDDAGIPHRRMTCPLL